MRCCELLDGLPYRLFLDSAARGARLGRYSFLTADPIAVGELAPGMDGLDLLRAAFSGGSITGAPKVRAMEIISELELSARGVYCGAIGYWSVTGQLDSSIGIRTAVALAGRVYFSVGGGIACVPRRALYGRRRRLARGAARRRRRGSFLDTEAHCSEATSSNLFAWMGTTLVTPPVSCGALPGITRAAVLELASAFGVPSAERVFGLDELFGAKEAFLTSSIRGLAPLVQVDAHSIGRGTPGALTRQLADTYTALIARECGT